MERLDIRQYLYHGVNNGIYKGTAKNSRLAILESILKDEYLICGKELNDRDVYSEITYYDGHHHNPRISLVFFPFNDKIYDISRSTSRYSDSMPEDLREYLKTNYGITEETFVMRGDICSGFFAWRSYYRGISLIFDPKLLEELKISDYAFFYDEICVDDKIPLRKYLVAVSLYNSTYTAQDEYGIEYAKKHNLNHVCEWIGNIEEYYTIKKLLKKYDYDVPLVEFISGRPLDEQGEILVRTKKNKTRVI